MKYLTFGIEIELTGVTRQRDTEVIARGLGTTERHVGGSYDGQEVKDSTNRTWKIVSDASLKPERKERGRVIEATSNYRVEVVSPICHYEDIEKLQEIVRALRKAGAFTNSSCEFIFTLVKKNLQQKY